MTRSAGPAVASATASGAATSSSLARRDVDQGRSGSCSSPVAVVVAMVRRPTPGSGARPAAAGADRATGAAGSTGWPPRGRPSATAAAPCSASVDLGGPGPARASTRPARGPGPGPGPRPLRRQRLAESLGPLGVGVAGRARGSRRAAASSMASTQATPDPLVRRGRPGSAAAPVGQQRRRARPGRTAQRGRPRSAGAEGGVHHVALGDRRVARRRLRRRRRCRRWSRTGPGRRRPRGPGWSPSVAGCGDRRGEGGGGARLAACWPAARARRCTARRRACPGPAWARTRPTRPRRSTPRARRGRSRRARGTRRRRRRRPRRG